MQYWKQGILPSQETKGIQEGGEGREENNYAADTEGSLSTGSHASQRRLLLLHPLIGYYLLKQMKVLKNSFTKRKT
jgi:hypothetical protein